MQAFNEVQVNFWLRRQRPCKRVGSINFGKCPVMYYVVTSGGHRSSDAQLGLRCSPNDWDLGKLPTELEDAKASLLRTLKEINFRYEMLNIPATGEMLLNDFLNRKKPARYLLAVAREFVEGAIKKQERGKITNGTLQGYRTKFYNLAYYVEMVVKRPKMTLHEVNNAFMEDMETYFRDDYKTRRLKRKGLGVLALAQHMQFMVNIMNYAQRRDYIQQNPVSVYAVDTSDWKPNKTYLTDEELERFRAVNVSDPRTKIAADIFLFLCETGMSYVDYCRMQDSWIKKLSDLPLPRDIRRVINPDEKWLIDTRQKSKIQFAVPVSLEAQRLLTLYGGASNMPKDFELNDINVAIRSIAKTAGIDKYLTSYVARKTFANYWRNQSGLSSRAASRLMGHSTDAMINHYADVQIESAVREVYARTA